MDPAAHAAKAAVAPVHGLVDVQAAMTLVVAAVAKAVFAADLRHRLSVTQQPAVMSRAATVSAIAKKTKKSVNFTTKKRSGGFGSSSLKTRASSSIQMMRKPM
jgi:hypothetical protein